MKKSFVVILGILLTACSSNPADSLEANESTVQDSTTENTSTENSSSSEEMGLGIGQEFQTDIFSYTVNSIEILPEKDLIVLNITQKNITAESQKISPLTRMTLRDDQNHSFTYDLNFKPESGEKLLGEIAPGSEMTGLLGYRLEKVSPEKVFLELWPKDYMLDEVLVRLK